MTVATSPQTAPASSPLGLIAGEGIFPLLVARGALRRRTKGRRRRFRWQRLARTPRGSRCLQMGWRHARRPMDSRPPRQGCTEAILVGRVAKEKIYSRWRWFQYIPDFRTLGIWFRVLHRDKRDHTVLTAVDRELASEGIHLIDQTKYCAEHLATPGVLTRTVPTQKQWDDIRYGWEICQTISRLDIGQSIAVVDKNVVAVEAVEGTNAMIDRAGQLCKVGGWTLIKVSNVRQDMRLDVPTVGTTTIEKMHANRAAALVLEPGKTIILEKAKVLELADRYKITIVGYSPEASPR